MVQLVGEPQLENDGGTGEAHPWNRGVPAEQQIRGLGPIMISIPDRKTTDLVLPHAIGMREVRDYATPANKGSRTHVYGRRRPRGGAPRCCRAQYPCSRAGRGRRSLRRVPHPRRRLPRLAERLQSHRPADRLTGFYFRSLYFREPNGILFEMATDGPGFVMDGPLGTLGERHRPQLCASETSLSAPPIEAQMNQPACRRPYACAWCLG